MKRWVGFIAFLLLLSEIYSFLPHRSLPKSDPATNYVQGIFHVHSVYSDGSGSYPQISQAAEQAGYDFIVITDHNDTRARGSKLEKRYGNTDVFVEMETSTIVGHALTFFSHSKALGRVADKRFRHEAYDHFLGKKRYPELFLAIAHPWHPQIPWTTKDRYSEGIEVINYDSIWRNALRTRPFHTLVSFALLPFNPYLATQRTLDLDRRVFAMWDAANAFSPRPHFAILSPDTHAKIPIYPSFSIDWPGYAVSFRFGTNVVYLSEPLSDDFQTRKKQIYTALRNAHAAMAFTSLAPFHGNDAALRCGNSAYRAGSVVDFAPNCHFKVTTPKVFPYRREIRVWKDGLLYQTLPMSSDVVEIPLKVRGRYRIEVWAHLRTRLGLLMSRWVPYVLYNPIFVE